MCVERLLTHIRQQGQARVHGGESNMLERAPERHNFFLIEISKRWAIIPLVPECVLSPAPATAAQLCSPVAWAALSQSYRPAQW